MSWFSQNYEKAALGGAAVAALGLAVFGWLKVGAVEEEFNVSLAGSGNNDPSVKDAGLVPQAVSSLRSDVSPKPGDDEGREVDLFTGIPLFVSRTAPTQSVDLVKGDPVHPPIPNSWWLQYKLDPGFGDSPQRDPDGDGFSNLDEFEGGTNPTDPQSYPSIIAKLTYLRDESVTWVLRPGFESEGGYTFNYDDSNRVQARATAAAVVMPGELFFSDKGPVKNRFKLLGSETRKEMNERIREEVNVEIVRVEDQRENKKGLVYELPAQFSNNRRMEFAQYDRTAVFSLEALGQEGREFKIEENTAFSLPPGGDAKTYFLKSVTPEGVEVEYTDSKGEKKTVQISKGSFPVMNP